MLPATGPTGPLATDALAGLGAALLLAGLVLGRRARERTG